MRLFALIGGAVLLLIACSPDESSRDAADAHIPGEADPAQVEAVPDPVLSVPVVLGAEIQQAHYDLDGMKAAGVLKVLVGYSHTHYFMDGLRLRGISAENLRQFEPYLQQALSNPRPKINVLPLPVARNEMIDFLERGYGDIAIGNITVTEERAAQVDFSVPIRRDVAEVIVHGKAVASIEDLDALSGKTVFVRASSSFRESLEFLSLSLKAKGLQGVRIQPMDEHLQTEDILELVNAGAIDITVADDHMAEFWSGVLENIVVRNDLAIRTDRQIAWAVRKDLAGMKAIVDGFVREHREGTLVGNVLFQRYLKNNKYVHNASSSADRKRFEAMTEVFKKFSREYEFDWLLLAAQGYQESRLIQSKRSPAGAIGVMQLLPTTAKAPPVDIANIEELEANIHAGHKYLRHISDHYLDDSELTELNRHLLAFAAYNAGPTRINRLRRQAPAEGVDPDVWFGEMEHLVARKVGMEPVTYVRNIFKYYVTYKLMHDASVPIEQTSAGGS